MTSKIPPKNWPPNLPYLTQPIYSKTIPSSTLLALRTPPTEDTIAIPHLAQNTPRGPSALVRITPITDTTHPAHGQNGLFAARDLKPGTFILQYLGEIHLSSPESEDQGEDQGEGEGENQSEGKREKVDPHATSDYDLSLDRDLRLGIDAARMGNEARFINDYRGVRARPNAEFRELWDEGRRERGMGVFVLPERKERNDRKKGNENGKGKWLKGGGIAKGEEILVSYGRGFWGARKGEDVDDGGSGS